MWDRCFYGHYCNMPILLLRITPVTTGGVFIWSLYQAARSCFKADLYTLSACFSAVRKSVWAEAFGQTAASQKSSIVWDQPVLVAARKHQLLLPQRPLHTCSQHGFQTVWCLCWKHKKALLPLSAACCCMCSCPAVIISGSWTSILKQPVTSHSHELWPVKGSIPYM